MINDLFKILTFLLLLVPVYAFSNILQDQKFDTHYSLLLNTPKSTIQVSKKRNEVVLKTLDLGIYEKLVNEFERFSFDKKYVLNISYKPSKTVALPSEIIIETTSKAVELFSFYKESKSQYSVDLWINTDLVETKNASIAKKATLAKATNKIKTIKKKPISKKTTVSGATKTKRAINPELIVEAKQKGYRDFRYGSAFLWDYPAYLPELKVDVDLNNKAPDYLYEVKDREIKDDKKEAHMQLTINFYRKAKWGLLTRSIKLYEEKYGSDKNKSFNDFLKSVSMIRSNLEKNKKQDRGIMLASLNILDSVVQRTEDYYLKSASLRYLVQDAVNQQDFVKSLKYAKLLFVLSSENFADEQTRTASEIIIHSLAKLKQVDKLKEFMKTKVVKRVLPKAMDFSYISYVYLTNNQTAKLIKEFKQREKSFVQLPPAPILYNVAEAFHREADYGQSIKYFDKFLVNYSQKMNASYAYLRLAVNYDLLSKEPKKLLKLYETAINHASLPKVRYEAKTRYVGLRVARKLELLDSDQEVLAFLSQKAEERRSLTNNERKLLWLTRMRTMVNQKKYLKALSYLNTIPVESLSLPDKGVFLADGAEIVLGLIKEAYLAGDYSKVVKYWEVYKEKYETKVAKSPYLNYIVADSYIQLKLDSSFNKSVDSLSSLSSTSIRTFPRWVKAHKNLPVKTFVSELRLKKMLADKKYVKALDFLESDKNIKKANLEFYKAFLQFKTKQYSAAVTNFERVLVSKNKENKLSPVEARYMLEGYSESLFQLGDMRKFRKTAQALISDLRKLDSSSEYDTVLERIEYLYIESLYTENTVTKWNQVEMKTKEFLGAFGKNSNYKNRVKLIQGISYLRQKNVTIGKKVLETIIEDSSAPEYIKGLARTELADLAIENKTF